MKMSISSIGKIGLVAYLLLVISCSNGQTKLDTEKKNKTKAVETIIPEFDIKFPETEFKIEKTESRNPNLGNILITNWILQGAEQNRPFMYFVAHNEFPKKLKDLEQTDPNSLNVAFQAMLTSSATKLGGTDFEFKEIKYNDFKGMESICKVFNGDGIIKSRVYKINNDLFMISAGGQKINMETVDNFLDSFKLKE